MTLLRMSPTALSRSRFALSPLAETVGSLIVLSRQGSDPWLASWHARHHGALIERLDADPFARGLVRLLGSTKRLPDLVAIPPMDGMQTVLATELARVANLPDDDARADLETAVAHSWERHDVSWWAGRGLGPRAANLLRHVWDSHVAPDWRRRRALLERDITYRAGLITTHGWPRALEDMSRRSAWVGADSIRFSDEQDPDRVIGSEGMLFVPVSTSSGSWLCETPPDRYALVYPARGSASAARDIPPHALGKLIGAGRATILFDLERPATTSELAVELGQSLGTVGSHLAVLRNAGLVAGTRVGRRVVYRRTESGDQLVGSCSS